MTQEATVKQTHLSLARRKTIAGETPAEKRSRYDTAKELDRLDEEARQAAVLEARKAKMPGLLFELMAEVSKLSRAGLDVDCEFVGSATDADTYNRSETGYPGVRVTFGRQAALRRHNDDGYRDSDVVTVVSEEWRLDTVKGKLEGLQAEYDEMQRQKALAEEAKKLLTPEQLAALKQFG